MEKINIDYLKKIEIKIGKILSAEKIENSQKLLKLSVDFEEDNPRVVLSGISKYFENPSDLLGRKCAFVTNLEEREMLGMKSQAMILAVSGETEGQEFFSTLDVNDSVIQGASVK